MTKEELENWKKEVKVIYQDATYERDSDTISHIIYEDKEGNCFQVDYAPSGFNKSEPINYQPIPVKKTKSYWQVKRTRFIPVTEKEPYNIVEEDVWEEIFEIYI
jgi:hypothetical protein